jgi:hypothetical protein
VVLELKEQVMVEEVVEAQMVFLQAKAHLVIGK